MKNITKSLLMITAVAALAIGGTVAYFSDTETSTGNTISTGTIDISIGGTQTTPYELEDMKPGYTDYMNFTINNVGSNPANVWKKLYGFNTTRENDETEYAVGDPVDLQNAIIYDLAVKVYDASQNLIWFQTIYTDSDGKTLADVYGSETGDGILLGMIPSKGYMEVTQSYYMDPNADNRYQGEKMTFDMDLYAEQLTNTVTLVHKDGSSTSDIVQPDAATEYATVEYKVKDAAFNYTINVVGGAVPDGDYTLISYLDPWPGANSTALANVHVTSGVANVSGSIDLGKSLKNAKTWLVPGTYTPGSATGSLTWNPGDTLFETALMDYYDADVE